MAYGKKKFQHAKVKDSKSRHKMMANFVKKASEGTSPKKNG